MEFVLAIAILFGALMAFVLIRSLMTIVQGMRSRNNSKVKSGIITLALFFVCVYVLYRVVADLTEKFS